MKTMTVNAAICDARNVQEDTLAGFDRVTINGALLITNPRTRTLLTRYNVQLNCARAIDLDDETTLNTLNGRTLFTGRNTPNGRQYLLINGRMTITPDAGDALRQYMGLSINGAVYCPDSLATVLASKADINGKLYTYPDGAVVLSNNTVLDRAFALRAQNRLYWSADSLIAVDEELDGAALADTGARFSTRKAYLTETLAETLAPLFDADTELVVLPDGVSVVQDDLTVNAVGLRRYGDSLVVLGDLHITGEAAEALSNLEYLQVEGDVYLPEGLADALDAVTESILDGEVYYLPGKPLFDKLSLTVDKNLLDAFPDGLTLVSCLNVTLADDLDPADVLDRLAFYDCAKICCRSALQSVVSAVANGTLQIELTDCPDEDEAAPGDLGVNAASYTL